MPAPSVATEVADGVTALARWAARSSAAELSEPVLRRALLILFDDLAAIIAARDEAEVKGLQAGMTAMSGPREATIFRGGRGRADRYSAAVANAAACDWCELDEGYRRALCHGGLYTVPSVLAEGEASGATIAAMARALTIGYEIAARFARAFVFPAPVLHGHGSLAAIGAASAIAALRGVGADRFLAAITAASTLVAPGPFNHAVQGALVRNVWPAAGAWCGMRAVDWSGLGIGGLPQSPYDVFVRVFGAEPRPTELTDGLGANWVVGDGYHKIHACCQYAHSAVEAAVEALAKLPHPPGPDDIAAITVETHRLGMALDNATPATTLAAKFSMPHVLAATCLFGHAGAEAFFGTTLHDPAFARLRARVVMRPYPNVPAPPHDRPARVILRLGNGAEVDATCLSARGGPDRPFALDEILTKIERIVAPVYPALPGLARRLIGLETAALKRTWTELVTEFAGPAAS